MINFDIEVLYGWCETEQRMVASQGRFGFETRKVWRDDNGVIREITGWSPPFVWFSWDSEQKPTLFEQIKKWFQS